MRPRSYWWRITPPPEVKGGPVIVSGPRKYEAIIAAAKIWGVPWSKIATAARYERLGEENNGE